jgi:hypothetical protein
MSWTWPFGGGPAKSLAASLRNGRVPQHQDLRVFGCIAAREQRQPAERPDHEQVGEAEERDLAGAFSPYIRRIRLTKDYI